MKKIFKLKVENKTIERQADTIRAEVKKYLKRERNKKLPDKFDILGQKISIRCFTEDPSLKSSLKFLRKTPWARSKVENLYIETQRSQDMKDENKI